MMNAVVPLNEARINRASAGTKALTLLATKKGKGIMRHKLGFSSGSPSFLLTFLQIADGLIIVLQFQVTLTQEKVGLD